MTIDNVFERVKQIALELIRSERRDGGSVPPELVPKDFGVYLFCDKKSDKAAYVGSAVGKNGLHQRIIKQHLWPGYTKSVFRKDICKKMGVDPKEESVHYIRETFTVSWFACPNDAKSVIHAAEALLIAALCPTSNKDRH